MYVWKDLAKSLAFWNAKFLDSACLNNIITMPTQVVTGGLKEAI